VPLWGQKTSQDSDVIESSLLSSGGTEEVNLCFECLFGKMINAQNMLVQIMADRTHRVIKNAIQAIAT
jgi:hypothetical protein